MTVVFWLPLALSVIGTGYFVLYTEVDRKWKLLAFSLVGLSLVLQLLPAKVPFIVPLLLQSAVAIWMAIYWKMDG